jgi:pimeloyl-ACP methyl ester carboxylesterase
MNTLKSALITALFVGKTALFAVSACAGTVSNPDLHQFVNLPNGQALYVEYAKAAQGMPTLIVLNGLTYDVRSWDRMMAGFYGTGIGILRYDPRGQGMTLLKDGPLRNPVTIETQADDLAWLIHQLNIRGPVNLLGLSYGGGLAIRFAQKYPQAVGRLFLMAPYTQALEGQDRQIRQEIQYDRSLGMYSNLTDDQLYDQILYRIVRTTYPQAEPSVLSNPYKLDATFYLSTGIRKYNAADAVRYFPAHSVYLMIAENDQYIPRATLEAFWSRIPRPARASKIVIQHSEHKIPDAQPVFAAWLVQQLLSNNPSLTMAGSWKANPLNWSLAPDRAP